MIDPKLALMVFFGTLGIAIVAIKLKLWSTLFANRSQLQKALVEDVLKQLFHVEYSGRKAGLNEMAGALKISDKKLVDVIELTTREGLIESSQEAIQLTSKGRDYALNVIRIHRLWEKHLSERTGFHQSEWHDLAERKEHSISREQAEQLYQDLGSPRFDPHGDPIPLETGEIIDSEWSALSSLKKGAHATITHIEDEPKVIYKQIIAQKLHMGSDLRIIESNEHHIRFYCEGNEYALSPIVASNISVKEHDPKEQFQETQVRLSSLLEGEEANVVGISSECRGASRRRLLDLGFIEGTSIRMEYAGPMKNPKAYLIKNTLIALRNDQAELILIEKE